MLMVPVAPRAGAWIEIQNPPASSVLPRSLPVRERGLKSFSSIHQHGWKMSLPVRERGLKSSEYSFENLVHSSLPVRERGLK